MCGLSDYCSRYDVWLIDTITGNDNQVLFLCAWLKRLDKECMYSICVWSKVCKHWSVCCSFCSIWLLAERRHKQQHLLVWILVYCCHPYVEPRTVVMGSDTQAVLSVAWGTGIYANTHRNTSLISSMTSLQCSSCVRYIQYGCCHDHLSVCLRQAWYVVLLAYYYSLLQHVMHGWYKHILFMQKMIGHGLKHDRSPLFHGCDASCKRLSHGTSKSMWVKLIERIFGLFIRHILENNQVSCTG